MDYTKKLLEVRDLHKAYSKEGVPTKALNGITFDVLSGEYLGIMGASGSGKTTLLNCIATVIKPTSGQILLSGANISAFDGAKLAEYRGNRIGYLFQDFALLDNLTGRENILLPLSIHNIDSSIAEKHLNDIAGFLGITDVLSKFPAQMSGGQKQRVAAARSLISDPDIILADEPTGSVALVQHYPKIIPVMLLSRSTRISDMTERQSVRFSSRVRESYMLLKSACSIISTAEKSGGVSSGASSGIC